MRRYRLFFLVLFFVSGVTLAAPAVELGDRGVDAAVTLDARQESHTTTNNDSSSTFTATTTNIEEATTTTGTATTTVNSNTGHTTYAATTVPSLDTSGTSGSQSAQNESKSTYSGGLPIQPQITPALGVGGFILLILGGALALIGIRKQWIHIFLSTAFLTALGVTVLIIYVMKPPVSNAVQGTYLVAIFFTGAIFGGLALVFREITEGLGCLLGGFCIGMWLLTLKSGGLVTGSGAKAGFILAFTVVSYCLSFSHYTRTYGSILCTAFAGATALVLGIDCYSRAGLKEFWLYIWGLNDNMFPLNTYTYPVTRNIRVEIAAIIVITAFGVISQLRLWKAIQDRRAKEKESRKEAEEKNDEAEAEIGRELEEKNLKERTAWEHVYGNRHDGKEASLSETAVADDSRRGSDGFGGREKGNSFEMKDMASVEQFAAASDCERPLDTVDELVPDDAAANENIQTQRGHVYEQDQDKLQHRNSETSRPASLASPKSSGTISDLHDDDSEDGAVVGSDVGTPRSSRRISGRSLMNSLSWRSGKVSMPRSHSQSAEALVVHDDANSSVAGVVDDIQTISSGCPSVTSEIHGDRETEFLEKGVCTGSLPENNALSEVTGARRNSQAHRSGQQNANTAEPDAHERDDINDENHAPVAQTDDHNEKRAETLKTLESHVEPDSRVLKAEDLQPDATLASVRKNVSNAENAVPEKQSLTTRENEEHQADQAAPSDCNTSQPKPTEESKRATLDVTTVQSLPEQTSKVVHSFRTKEWAKHLADAEAPNLEPLELNNEVQEEQTERKEAAAPVDIDCLLQTPFNSQPPAVNSPDQTPTSPEHTRRSHLASSSSPEEPRWSRKRNSLQNTTTARSSPPLSRNTSSASLIPQQLEQGDIVSPLRSSTSTPFLTVTAPDNDKNKPNSPRWSGPAPLLAVRENMVRNRMSSTSLRYDPWASRSHSRQSLTDPTRIASPTFSIPEERDENVPESSPQEDDVPLSKRRAMLQRQNMQSPSATSLQSFDPPHSPPRAPAESGRSAALMAAWRQSVQEDLSQRRDPLALHSTPLGATSPERPRSLWRSVQQMRDASTTQLGNAIADEMQRGSMTDLHRQAMRRMQASANRQL